MSWRTEWTVLSERIQGLTEGADYFVRAANLTGNDRFGITYDFFRPALQNLCQGVSDFRARYGGQLPTPAARTLDEFLRRDEQLLRWASEPGINIHILAAFKILRSELNYHLSNREIVGQRLVERAFQHLKRSIIVDATVANMWQTAFSGPRAEEACEQLGGVHLLLHGIWAFKVWARGERTDLVLGTRLTDTSEAERSADAMALTEWKIARMQNEVDPQVQQAFTQASIYAGSGLAGFELSLVRYLVIVTEDRLQMPGDRQEGDVLYRIINIPVRPSTPSASRAP